MIRRQNKANCQYVSTLDCYKMVYDLSNDKEIANRISYLEKEHYSDR